MSNSTLKDFTNQTGLYRDRVREQSYGFNKSVSQKAVAVVKRNQSFIEAMQSIGIKTLGFDKYAGNTRFLNEMKSAYTKLAEEYPEEIKDVILRYGFSKDKSTVGWYDKNKCEIVYNKNIFDYSDTLIKDYEKCVETRHFPKGTDYRSYFYHEFGHRYSDFHNIDNKKIVKDLTQEYYNGYYTKKKANELLCTHLSEYSVELTKPQYQEVIAECFSEWYNSDNPRQFCKKYLEKVGVIK